MEPSSRTTTYTSTILSAVCNVLWIIVSGLYLWAIVCDDDIKAKAEDPAKLWEKGLVTPWEVQGPVDPADEPVMIVNLHQAALEPFSGTRDRPIQLKTPRPASNRTASTAEEEDDIPTTPLPSNGILVTLTRHETVYTVEDIEFREVPQDAELVDRLRPCGSPRSSSNRSRQSSV